MESAKMGSFNPVEKECKKNKVCPECKTVNYGKNASPLLKPSWGVLTGAFFAIVVANFLLD